MLSVCREADCQSVDVDGVGVSRMGLSAHCWSRTPEPTLEWVKEKPPAIGGGGGGGCAQWMDILAEALRWGLRGGPKSWRDLNSGRNRSSKTRIILGLAAHWKDWLVPPEWAGEPLGELGPTMKSSDISNGELWLLCLKKTSELPKSNINTRSHLWF